MMCHESPPKKTFIYYVVEVTPTTSVCKRFVVKLVVALVFFQKKKVGLMMLLSHTQT